VVARAQEVVPGVKLATHSAAFESPEQWKSFVKEVGAALGSGVVAVVFDADAPQIFITVSADLLPRGISAGELVKVAVGLMDGRGGGRPEMAQGTGTRRDAVPAAMSAIADTLRATAK
jgi:alanyl-tRNA synthetase